MSIYGSDVKQAIVTRWVRQAENPETGAEIRGVRKDQAMARAVHIELKATGREILGLGGELPVKFRGVSGVVAELVPVGHYKTP